MKDSALKADSHSPGAVPPPPRWVAWPVPVMMAVLGVLWWLEPHGSYDPPWLLFLCNLLFATLASAWIAVLASRSFLAQPTPGLAWLIAGVAFYGLAGVLATGLAGGNANAMIATHNVSVWWAALCHLLGVVLPPSPRPLRGAGGWLLAAVAVPLAISLAVAQAAWGGWLPDFFVQGGGGSAVRAMVLGSAAGMFCFTAILLLRRRRTAFQQWYALALLLIATGLVGLMLQREHGSVLGWTARATSWAGSVYLTLAALALARESNAREVSLAAMPADGRLRYALAVVLVAVATVVRMTFLAGLGTRAATVTFFPAVILAALYGGRGPALLAAGLSIAILKYFWMQPVRTFALGTPEDWVILGIFAATSVLIAFVAESVRVSRERLAAAEARRAADVELQASDARAEAHGDAFARLIESAPFGVYAVDADFRLALVSAGSQRVFASVRPLLGRDFGEVLRAVWPEPFASEVIALFRRTLETGEPFHAPNTTQQRADVPATETYDWQIAREMLPDGRLGVVCYFYDATERERAASELQAARDAAEAASLAKDHFLAQLSHELRTPLTPALLLAQDLRDDPRFDPETRDALGMIERNIALEARLIDDLLDVTRIARGKLTLEPEECDLHRVLDLAAGMVRDEARRKGVTLEIAREARRTALLGDPARLQQVFWNLLRNAVKFTPAGGRVAVRTYEMGGLDGRANCSRLAVEVRDSGIGFEPAAATRIFQPFEQETVEGRPRQAGLGLGLAIARGIVELHEGAIRAESPGVGRGAVFIVELPGTERGV